MVNKFFYNFGGTEQVFFELSNILEKNGHQVIPFSMQDKKNKKTDFEKYFPTNLNYKKSSIFYKIEKFPKIISRVIYSPESRRKITRLIRDTRPDIAHIHMIEHHISPSILYALKEFNIPIVQSVNTYKIVCPNYLLYNKRRGGVCERCIGGQYYNVVINRCVKNSLPASLLACMEMYIHRWTRVYRNLVDLYIVSNNFRREKMISDGYQPRKIKVLHHPLNVDNYHVQEDIHDYFVYFGRFSREKGILTLLKAMEKVKLSKLILIGQGEQEKELKEFVRKNELNNIEFIGPKWGRELQEIVGKAKFVVLPSEWYEGVPMVIYQSFAMGKPVIGAKIGGIPEEIDDGINGLLFNPGDIEGLSAKINFLLRNRKACRSYGMNARKKAEAEFHPQTYYTKIYRIYQELLSKKGRAL